MVLLLIGVSVSDNRLQLIPDGAKCKQCDQPAAAWHPHIGLCCDEHLKNILANAASKPSYFDEAN